MFTLEWKRQRILDYVGKDYARCLYLYIDFCVYGQGNNPNVTVYVDKDSDGTIHAVVLSYYTSLHIYSHSENYFSDEIFSIIQRHEPTTIFAVAPIIRILADHLPQYKKSIGTVGMITQKSGVKVEEHIIGLDSGMLPDVADLLIDGQNYANRYKGKQIFLSQLRERYSSGMGRHYAILDRDGSIIAHAATYAEYENIAVASGIYTVPSCRRKGYALQAYAALCNDLTAEGKKVFAYYWSKHTADMHHKVGFYDVCEWGELKKE